MATIPMDIIITLIFLNLPAKSLLRFKCVCKSWRNYISTQEFISLHLNHSLLTSENRLIILTTKDNSLYSLLINPPHQPTKLHFPTSPESINKEVIGSHNGLICVNHVGRGLPIWVCNPSTGFFRNVPSFHLPSRPCVVNYGFGYDHVDDDYKIIRLMDYFPRRGFILETNRQISVYSLRTSAWRLVEWCIPYELVKHGENGAVLNNHLVHWMVWCIKLNKCKIRCFNLCMEKWVDDVPMISNMVEESDPNNRNGVVEFGVFDGYLSISLKNNQQSSQISVDVWIMKEYGVKESWMKLLSISDARLTRSLRVGPIVYSPGRKKILLRREYKCDNKLLWYNIQDGSIENAEFDGVGDCFWAEGCIGSLVNVPGGQQFGIIQHD